MNTKNRKATATETTTDEPATGESDTSRAKKSHKDQKTEAGDVGFRNCSAVDELIADRTDQGGKDFGAGYIYPILEEKAGAESGSSERSAAAGAGQGSQSVHEKPWKPIDNLGIPPLLEHERIFYSGSTPRKFNPLELNEFMDGPGIS